jgi:L-alanine-DL-glutamate epimerase-like enolase superfamily enzyme
MTAIESIHCQEIAKPLRVRFATAQGSKDVMRSVVVTVVLDDGATGLGECATSLSLQNETIQTIKNVLADVIPSLYGIPIDEYELLITQFRRKYPQHPMTISGLEVALFRAYLASMGKTEHAHWGGKTRTIETDITIPLVDDIGFIQRWLQYAFRKGFAVYKLKVSGDVERDKKILSFVYRMLSQKLDAFTLRLDGNQGFNVKTYAQFTEVIRKAGYAVELFEQPLPKDDLRGLKVVKHFSPFPVILDETVVTGDDARRVADENTAHGINIKIAKSGISESKAILRVAKECSLKLMIGCMTETMIGLSAAIYLATGSAAFDYIDLDAVFLIRHNDQFNDITIEGPRFILPS